MKLRPGKQLMVCCHRTFLGSKIPESSFSSLKRNLIDAASQDEKS